MAGRTAGLLESEVLLLHDSTDGLVLLSLTIRTKAILHSRPTITTITNNDTNSNNHTTRSLKHTHKKTKTKIKKI